jgi:Protein of unknown function (DUF1822)
MSMTQTDLTFTVNLTASARKLAEKLRKQQVDPQSAEQVYRNALAVYAVDFYCQCMGIKTDGTVDGFAKTIPRAALTLKNLGTLECLPILEETRVVRIPAKDSEDAIGTILVQLNSSLTEATLLGFVRATSEREISRDRVGSLEAFLDVIEPVNLSQWFEKAFEKGWQVLEAIVSPFTVQPTLNFRRPRIAGTKAIALETSSPLELVLVLTQECDREVDIALQVCSRTEEPLPAGLELKVIDESGEVFSNASAKTGDRTLGDRFCGTAGEQFTIKVSLGNDSFTENFVV